MYIVKLQMTLEENRIRNDPNKYKARTAATIQREKEIVREKQTRERDVILLLNEGYNADQAPYNLDIPFSEVARIEERNQARMKFLRTGQLPEEGGVFTIYQR
jgi:hypothetical protein